MVKPVGPGVFSATYSNIPVYEFQFGENLKEHVMRRRHDDWINATHILKAAGFDKPARTRILEREVQKELHEKVQGGYGKYQGTWVPLEQGQALAQRNNVYDKLRPIFEFIPGNLSPPPAPKHTTNKPKAPKKPAVPKWGNMPAPPRVADDNYDNISAQLNDDESVADDTTVASASYMAEDDRYDMSQQSTGHRKRKREEPVQNIVQQAHVIYSDELLDYFMLTHDSENVPKPEPPPNFQPDWLIDSDGHTAMHWAAAMGDVDIMKQLKRFGANLLAQNVRGETPLMRAVLFTNCMDKQTMPAVVKELISTMDAVDLCQATALHHAVMMTFSKGKHQCVRYYLDIILNKMQEMFEPEHVQRILDAQDVDGNTAIHIAAKFKARKCVRALMGRGATTDIHNREGVTAEDLIQELNATRKADRHPQASSSPFAPDSQRHSAFHDVMNEPPRHTVSHHSEAAMSVASKITPLMLEKFQDLAYSFDDELVDKDHSEKEAKRILNSTHIELATIREQILDLGIMEDNDRVEAENKAQLAHIEHLVTSLIEHQQQIQLLSRTQLEENQANGHMSNDDDVAERLSYSKQLNEELANRKQLVGQYRQALSMAGAGEKGEVYRRLISSCVDSEVDLMDENLDNLIEQLVEDQKDREGEITNCDEL
ncbi:hypothetical protein B7494_g8339 [Chlorociboria aeruginascens]|nr:hypothetical protein B7494_g8339 [Chlorociboria aeruginascens]